MAAITAGIVIYFGGPVIVDPILSIFVSALILHSSWGVVKTSVHLLLDGVPDNIPYQEVGSTLEAIPGVYAVHDLHIWDMTANEAALSSHIVLERMDDGLRFWRRRVRFWRKSTASHTLRFSRNRLRK